MRSTIDQRFHYTIPRAALLALATALTACSEETHSSLDSPLAEEAGTMSKDATGRGDSANKTASDAGVATASSTQQGMLPGHDGGSAAGAPAATASTGQAGGGGNPAASPKVPPTPSSATPPVMPPIAPVSGGGIDSGISDECNTQLTKCTGVEPDLIRQCVAVVRHCLPAEVSAACDAQLDKCELGKDPLVDCPLVAVMCP